MKLILFQQRIQSKRADLYLRGEPDYLHEDWLAKSVPIKMERVTFGHSIRDRNAVSIFNLLSNFNVGIGLFAVYGLSFLAILAFAFLLDELTRRRRFGGRGTVRLSQRIASVARSFEMKRFSTIGVFVLFVHLFLFITEHFLTNNIQTNKVVRLWAN